MLAQGAAKEAALLVHARRRDLPAFWRRPAPKGQAAIFNLTKDIRGEARIVERAFGIDLGAIAEAAAVIGERLELKPS